MVNLLYLFTSVCAYVQSEDYYYDRIAININGPGSHSLFLVDGVSDINGKLSSCVNGKCHSLDSKTTDMLKEQALAEASPDEPQFWYSEGLAAFLNNQSMKLQKKVTQLYKVSHNDNGATIKWKSNDIYIKHEGDKLLVVGPEETYELSNPHELLESTYQSKQYIQSSKVGRRYNQHSAVPVYQEDDGSPGNIVSSILFSPSV